MLLLKIERLDQGSVILAEVSRVEMFQEEGEHTDGKPELYLFVDSDGDEAFKLPATDQVAVYLMNDRGKTVDTLWPRAQPRGVLLEDGTVMELSEAEARGVGPFAESEHTVPASS